MSRKPTTTKGLFKSYMENLSIKQKMYLKEKYPQFKNVFDLNTLKYDYSFITTEIKADIKKNAYKWFDDEYKTKIEQQNHEVLK
jgi:hypothetical protein